MRPSEPKLDFLIIAPLEEEREALLRRLPDARKLPSEPQDVHVYYEAWLPLAASTQVGEGYRVIVTSPLQMGRVDVATLATQALARFQPACVLLVGIAGGIPGRVDLGDVIVSDQVVDYEHQKLTNQGTQLRFRVYAADPRLLARAQHLGGWEGAVQLPRPLSGAPRRHIGPVASGDKVQARTGALDALRADWPQLVGVEMEAAGVQVAVQKAAHRPGFLMVRGVSDLADGEKNSAAVAAWRPYACEVAAAFAICLMKDGPLASAPHEGRDGAPAQVCQQLPQQRNPRLVGRDAQLREIHDQLTSGDALRRCLVLTGMRGIGKTQLALEYAYQHSDDRADYSVVLWIRAASQEILRSEFAALAARLQLAEAQRVEPEQRIGAVRAWLETHHKWLLVIDGADEPNAAKWLSELLPLKTTGHLLITSTNPSWRAQGRVLPITLLDPDDAVRLLAQRSGLAATPDALILVEMLGRLPLAVVQAAAYLERTGTTCANYLQIFSERARDVMDRPLLDDYPRTVATTWSLSFDRVCLESAAAGTLLHLCSFLAPIPFPVENLAGIKTLPAALSELSALTDSLMLQDAIAVLRAYSLAETWSDHIWIHPLVQTMARHRLAAEQGAWATRTIELLRFCIGNVPDAREQWIASDILFPHVLVSVQHALTLGAAHHAVAAVGSYLGAYLQTHVSGLVATNVLARIEAHCRPVLGPADATLFELRIMGVRIIASLGDWRSAVQLLDELAAAVRSVPEADDRLAAAILIERGNALMQGGRHKEALESGLQALKRLDAPLQEPFRQYLPSANSLVGVALVALARPAEGRRYLEEALAQFSEAQRARSIRWPVVLHNFGQALAHLGDLAGAEQVFRQSIAQLETLLGPDHPDTGQCRLLLGQLLCTRGELEAGRKQLRKAFWSARNIPPPPSPFLAEALNALCETYLRPGYFRRARICAEWALNLCKQLFVERHPKTLNALSVLARAMHAVGEHRAARDYFEQQMAGTEELYGPDHPEMAKVLHNFGMLLIDLEETERGEKFLERALAIDEAVYGKDHFEVATDLNSIGLHYLHKGKWELALPRLERALAIRDKQLGPMVACTLDSIAAAADMLHEQGAWPMARRFYELVVAALERHAPDSAQLVQGLHNLVSALVESGDVAAAAAKHEQLLLLSEKVAGVPAQLRIGIRLQQARLATRQRQLKAARAALDVAERKLAEQPESEWTELRVGLRRNRGDVLMAEKDYVGAVTAFQAAIEILDTPANADSILLANLFIDLGNAEQRLKRLEDAEHHLERALAMTLRLRGDSHATTGTIHRRLGELRRARRDHAGAKQSFERAHRVWVRIYGPSHPQVGSALVDLGGEEVQLAELEAADVHLGTAQAVANALPTDPTADEIRRNLPIALARLRIRQKKLSEALEVIDQALASAAFQELAQRMSMMLGLVELAKAYEHNSAPEVASVLIGRVVALLEPIVNDEPEARLTLALQYRQLAMLHRACKRPREAADAMARGYRHLQQAPAALCTPELVAQFALSHANYLRMYGTLAAAKSVLSEALSCVAEAELLPGAPTVPWRALLQGMLGEVLLNLHEEKVALQHLLSALKSIEQDPTILNLAGLDPDCQGELHGNLGNCLLRLNQDIDVAVTHLRTSYRLEAEHHGEEALRTALAAFDLAKGLRQARQIQEAKQYARQAHQILSRGGPEHIRKAVDALHRQLRDSVAVPKAAKKKPKKR